MDWFAEYSKLMATRQTGQSDPDELPDSWFNDVLFFWFSELTPEDWFKQNDATDTVIGERFLGLYASVAELAPDQLIGSWKEALAAVIVLDQFPRNLFRGNGQSFKTDSKALKIAELAIAAGFDRSLTVDQGVFLYLPFEHSENMADQERAVELISNLGNDNYTGFALAHRDVIARFGRFPRRNEALGRVSTSEEIAYLAEPSLGF